MISIAGSELFGGEARGGPRCMTCPSTATRPEEESNHNRDQPAARRSFLKEADFTKEEFTYLVDEAERLLREEETSAIRGVSTRTAATSL